MGMKCVKDSGVRGTPLRQEVDEHDANMVRLLFECLMPDSRRKTSAIFRKADVAALVCQPTYEARMARESVPELSANMAMWNAYFRHPFLRCEGLQTTS